MSCSCMRAFEHGGWGGGTVHIDIYIYVFVTSLSTDREKELFFFFLGGKRVWGCMPLVLICFFGVLFLFVTSVETGHKVDFRLERVLLTIGVSRCLTPAFCAAPPLLVLRRDGDNGTVRCCRSHVM